MAASLCAQQNTRDETRTRKAIGRGILSPLRLPIPPPGRTVNLAKRISPSDRENGSMAGAYQPRAGAAQSPAVGPIPDPGWHCRGQAPARAFLPAPEAPGNPHAELE